MGWIQYWLGEGKEMIYRGENWSNQEGKYGIPSFLNETNLNYETYYDKL